jgi:hypothetical protein
MNFDFVIPVFAEAEVEFNDAIAQALRSRGLEVAFLTTTKRVTTRLRRTNQHVFFVYDGFNWSAPVTAQQIWELERRYRLGSMRGFVFPEHEYEWARDYETLERRAVHLFHYFETFFENNHVRWMFNTVGAELTRRVAAVIGKARGVGNAILDFAALHGSRYTLVSDEMGPRVSATPTHIAESDIQRARELLNSMMAARKPFAPVSKLGFGRANLRGAVDAFLRRNDTREVSVAKLVRERTKRVGRRIGSTFLYEPMVPDEPFIFFPLHLPNDSAITVRAPQFQQQDGLVQYVAQRALPAGTKLYVKPHIGARDSFELPFLMKLSRIPNVRLIAPTVNPYDLIEKSTAVLVINSTAGFEAVLKRKPVIVVGTPFYRRHNVTIDVDNLVDLPDAVERSLTFMPSEEDVLKFLHAYASSTFEGTYNDVRPENVERIASVLAELGDPSKPIDGNRSPERRDGS